MTSLGQKATSEVSDPPVDRDIKGLSLSNVKANCTRLTAAGITTLNINLKILKSCNLAFKVGAGEPQK